MRTYVKSSEIAHLWAHQTQPEGKCSAAMSFNGTKFFSYSTVIAEIVTVKKTGERIFVVSEDSYSNTTARQLGSVRRAIPHGARVFYVPGVAINSRERMSDPDRVLGMWREQAIWTVEEASNARQPKKNRLLIEASDIVDKMYRYAEALCFAKKKVKALIPKIPDRAEELDAWREQLEAARNKAELKRAAAAEKAAAERRAKENEALARWLSGEHVSYYELPRSNYAELRVVGDEVETSLGVTFPVAHAKRGLKLVDKVIESGTEWKANGHTCKLGVYTLNRITTDGTVYAGCHVVPIHAINRVRPQLEAVLIGA